MDSNIEMKLFGTSKRIAIRTLKKLHFCQVAMELSYTRTVSIEIVSILVWMYIMYSTYVRALLYILRIENISTWRGSTQQFHSGSLYRTLALLISSANLYIFLKVEHWISWNSHQLSQSHRRIFLSFWRKNCPSFETYWWLGRINQSGNCVVQQYYCSFCNNPNRWNYCSGIHELSRTNWSKKYHL